MKVNVEIAGRTHTVEAEQDAAGWRVTIDGTPVPVDARPLPGGWSLLVGGRSHDVSVEDTGVGELAIHVSGQTLRVSVADPRPEWPRKHRGDAAAGAGTKAIVAPMPGRVVKVLTKPGERVVARQGLVVVEAMKMENELRAPRDGLVTEVRVKEGMSVEANMVLVVLE